MWHHRSHSIINILGLSVGLASCLMIYLYVNNESNYDQHHSKKNRIFRIVSSLNLGGEDTKTGLSSYMLSTTLKKDYPEVEESIRVMPIGKQTVWVDENPFQFTDNFMGDTGFFKVFDYEFIEGDPNTCLTEPKSVVINSEVAIKLFGSETGNIGKLIKYSRQSYQVKAVIKDIKNNSHLYFNTLTSLNSIQEGLRLQLENDWFYMAQYNYVLLRSESDAEGFDLKLKEVVEKYIKPWLKIVNSEGQLSYYKQALPELHFNNEFHSGHTKTGNKSYIYIFSILAIFILSIACINYINLATAASSKRAKEIGIRKTSGAYSGELFYQFILESILTVTISFFVAIVWIYLLLPLFNQITEKSFQFEFQLSYLYQIPLLILLIGTIAGIYPAMYLSKLEPMLVLKSNKMPGGFSSIIKKALVVLQFIIALVFMICTHLIYRQMQFIKNAELGFQKEQVISVSLPVADSSFANKFEVIQQKLKANPNVKKIALSSNLPGNPVGMLLHVIEQPGKKNSEKGIDYMMVSHEYLDLLEIPVIKGRNFSKEYINDDTAAFIVNEKAIKTYSWNHPFEITLENGFGHKGKIIGVIKDFHYKSLHEEIQPMVLMLGAKMQGNLLIRIEKGSEKECIQLIESVFGKYSKKYPLEYFFLDDNFNKLYKNEDRLMKLFSIFSIISLILCCLGLYALLTYTLEQKVKEIGIRKVMGAGIRQIIYIINKEYIYLFITALMVSVPGSYYLGSLWLEEFANRIDLNHLIFLIPGLICLIVSGITLVLKTYFVANENPVNSLRYE
jgi:putative ABC transport system permease protein